MSYADDIRSLWLSIEDVAIPIAQLRDEYVRFPGIHRRFSQLGDVYRNLREIETALFEFMESKKPLMGSKPEREIFIIAQAAIKNARILLEVGKAELDLITTDN